MRVQKTSEVMVANSVRDYDGRKEALLLLATESEEIGASFVDVFAAHEGHEVDPEEDLPWDLDDVGDCRIDSASVILTIEGWGGSFAGLRLEVPWGRTSPEWHAWAERNGRVWLGLTSPADCARLMVGNWGERIPPVRMLKLDVVP